MKLKCDKTSEIAREMTDSEKAESIIELINDYDVNSTFLFGWQIEFIKKLCRKQLNNGWIPVSERLPNEEECNLYDVMHPCHRQFICTIKVENYEPQTRKLFFSDIFGWKYGLGDYNEYVMAWQPLPTPYRTEVAK